MFENLQKWTLTGIKFFLAIHYGACGWILILRIKKQKGYETMPFKRDYDFSDYVDSAHFMTTIVGGGYADFQGFADNSGNWLPEMIYLSFMSFIAIILFTFVTREVFSYKRLLTVEAMVKSSHKAMENYLLNISQVQKCKSLD